MGFRRGACRGVRAQIFRCEFVCPFVASLEVGRELECAEAGPFLDADPVREKQCEVRGHHEVLGGFTFRDDVEPVHTCVLLLVESQVSEFHYHPHFLVVSRLARTMKTLLGCVWGCLDSSPQVIDLWRSQLAGFFMDQLALHPLCGLLPLSLHAEDFLLPLLK
jgi:hypothetical protein